MTLEEPQVKKGRRICTIEGCDEVHHSLGYCRAHYMRARRGMSPEQIAKKGRHRTGPHKLGADWVVLIRLSDTPTDEWRDHLAENHGLVLHRNAIYQARTGKTYHEVPMDRDALLLEAERRGLDVPE